MMESSTRFSSQTLRTGLHSQAVRFFLSLKPGERRIVPPLSRIERREQMAAVGKEIMSVAPGSEVKNLESEAFGADSYVSVAPIGTSGMKLVAVAPKSDYSGAITQAMLLSVIISLIVIIVLCAAMWYIFDKRVDAPIQHLMGEAQKMADGNLNVDLTLANEDELGALAKSMDHMADSIRGIIAEVNNMAQQVSAASEELTASSQQAADAATHVAESVVDVAGWCMRSYLGIRQCLADTTDWNWSILHGTLARTDGT